MRAVLFVAIVILTGCDYGFTFHPEEMTPDQMLQRAELVFIGKIEGQHFDSWPFFRAPGVSAEGQRWWRPRRRRVRVETVLRGSYSQKEIQVYEIFWTDGTSGDWNSTQDNRTYLFMVRREAGRWQIVRDWRRSIYPVSNGYHQRLPLDESRPLWERYALMNYWIGAGQEGSDRMFRYDDPGGKLGPWRKAKLLRGLLHHPQRSVRRAACSQLGPEQDECLGTLPEADLRDTGSPPIMLQSPTKWNADGENQMRDYFESDLLIESLPRNDPRRTPFILDGARLLTTINHPILRREFCRKFMARFPNDTDNGCPANKPPPATIVTENGDVPLVGEWPTWNKKPARESTPTNNSENK